MSRTHAFVLIPAALLAAFAVFAGLALSESGDAPGRKYALVVGVKSYPQGEGLGDLKHTEDDADALAAVLTDRCGFRRVVVMTQAKGAAKADLLPTADNIQDNLKSLLEDCKRGDTVLVAFSGHGIQLKVDGRDEAFFCPMDARPSRRKNLVALSDVYKQMDGSIADVKLLLADCCRNDAEGKGAGGDNLAPPEPPRGVAALFSCSKGQRSFESEEFKQGIFFHYVIEGLKGQAANKKGEVTLATLADYVQDEVPDRVKQETSPLVRQVPNLVGDVSGKLTLAKADASGSSPPDTPTPTPKPSSAVLEPPLTTKVHILLVFDTNAEYLKQVLALNEDKLNKLITADRLGANGYDLTVLKGDEVTADGILKYYKDLAVAPTESVFCYYAGPGGYDDKEGLFFDLKTKGTGSLVRSKLLDAMKAKNGRLTALVTDCNCNAMKAKNGRLTAPLPDYIANKSAVKQLPKEVTSAEAAPEDLTKPSHWIKALLQRNTGVVDINSCDSKTKQRSFAIFVKDDKGDDLTKGSLFTDDLVTILGRELPSVSDVKNASWPAFFDKVKAMTQDDYKKLIKGDPLVNEDPVVKGQEDQTPEALVLDAKQDPVKELSGFYRK